MLSQPLFSVTLGQSNRVHLLRDQRTGTLGRVSQSIITLRPHSPLPVITSHNRIFPFQGNTFRGLIQRDRTYTLSQQILPGHRSHQQPLQRLLVQSRRRRQHAPHGNIIQRFHFLPPAIHTLHVQRLRMNPLVERAHGHTIRGSKHRQTDIRTGKSHGTGNRLVVIHHQRGSHRFPVIRHQSNCRFITHNLFRFLRQLSQHGRVRTREHQLDRVLLVHQIITLHPHVSIRVMSRQVILNLGHRRLQLFRGRIIHDQLPVTHRGLRDRTHQIITGRCPADTRCYMSHL